MSSPARRIGTVVVATMLAALCGTPWAASQLFKCVDGGRTVYQQQACPVSTQPDAAASAPRVAEAASAGGRRIRPSSPLSPASATLR